MDRFIVNTTIIRNSYQQEFKIQYGQIYSIKQDTARQISYLFKIQYGQIYRNQRKKQRI